MNPEPHAAYHRLPPPAYLNMPRYRALRSSLATLIQLRNEEENEDKTIIYTNSIKLLENEISALTSHLR